MQAWYAWFLEHLVLPNTQFWSYLVTWGEILVAVGLADVGLVGSGSLDFAGFGHAVETGPDS